MDSYEIEKLITDLRLSANHHEVEGNANIADQLRSGADMISALAFREGRMRDVAEWLMKDSPTVARFEAEGPTTLDELERKLFG